MCSSDLIQFVSKANDHDIVIVVILQVKANALINKELFLKAL